MVQLSIHRAYRPTKVVVLFILMCSAQLIYSQETDSLSIDNQSLDTTIIDSLALLPNIHEIDSIKPTFTAHIGLGTGKFAFKGDVGNHYSQKNPLVSNQGYQLVVTAPISTHFDITFNTLFGKLTVHERSNKRNLNFQTQIRGGGIGITYNFKNLLGSKRLIYPYLSAGISSFEFLSKTDILDKNGNPYHYWTDGSIRDLSQTDPGATDAQIITQDYVYETDLRELNLDEFGDYKERTFSYPIGAGVNIPISEKVNFQIGTSLYFNQTDFIDNVTSESIGERAGDSKNDRFLFTNFSLSYNIAIKGKSKQDLINEDLLASSGGLDQQDEDNDGVIDLTDDCPHTPKDVKVDENGCPLDNDKDFVPNYKDKELMTSSEMEVDTLGIGLQDEYFLRVFTNYQKMWSEPNIIKETIISGDEPLTFKNLEEINKEALAMNSLKAKQARNISIHNRDGSFHVLFGATKDGITKDLSMLLLSIPDIKTTPIGDSTYYMTKSYDELEDAILRQMSLFIDGVGGKVIEVRNDKIYVLDNETQQIQDDILNVPELIDKDARGITYRVQLGAFSSDREISIYNYLDGVVKLKGEDGLTRYLSGSFKTPEQAAKHRIDLLSQGYTGAFISAYKDAERIELEDAGMEVVNKIDYDKLWNEVNVDAFDKEYLEYRVMLGKFEGRVPPRMVNKFITIGDVDPLRYKRYVHYLKGHFKSYDKAKEQLEELIKDGIIAAEIIGVYKGKVISSDEVQMMLEMK